MASSPAFASTPVMGGVTVSTANAARDGSGTTGTVLAGGDGGTRVDVINIKAGGTTTAGMVRLFLSNGSSTWLLQEVPVTAITASATVATFETAVYFPEGLNLPSGWSLKASTEKGEAFNVIARGGNF